MKWILFFLPVVVVFSQSASLKNWSYRGTNGPDSWGGACSNGVSQSPINIVDAEPGDTPDMPGGVVLKPLVVNYRAGPVRLVNNGKFFSIVVGGGNTITDNQGRDYTLQRIDFHTPSEHRLRGLVFPVEMQFIHRRRTGEFAAISVLVKEGKKSLTLGSFLDMVPTTANTERKMHTDLNPADLLPKEHTYFTYSGSLTSPPCSEPTLWWVLDNYYHASENQVSLLKELFPAGNSRSPQPDHGRVPKEFRRAADAKHPI